MERSVIMRAKVVADRLLQNDGTAEAGQLLGMAVRAYEDLLQALKYCYWSVIVALGVAALAIFGGGA